MIEQIALETAGFRFSFDIDYNWTDQEYLGMVVTLQLLPPLKEMTVCSERTSISMSDLRRLQSYIEQHMLKLGEKHGDAESEVFVNWELGFKMQALSGDVEPPEDGMFSIICSVNVGNASDDTRVYMGGESGVTFEQARAFLYDIQTFLDALPTLPAQITFGAQATENGDVTSGA